MKEKLNMEIRDVYGGDGFVRIESEERRVLERASKSVVLMHELGTPLETDRRETKTEEKEIDIQTFRRDEDGTPMLRMGGVHGKLWGCLKELGKSSKDTSGLFKSYAEVDRLMRCVNISPIWVRLENSSGGRVDTLPQILAGRSSSMITMHYDVLEKCSAEVVISYPDAFAKRMAILLEMLGETAALNKRRSSIVISKRETLD